MLEYNSALSALIGLFCSLRERVITGFAVAPALGNANPRAFSKPRVCGFDGLETRVSRFNCVSSAAGPCWW